MKTINNIGYEFYENKKWWVVEGVEENFSESALTILDGAFRFCKSLKFIIGEISVLGEFAFTGCCNINTPVFADGANISEKSLMSAVIKRLQFQGCANIKEPNTFKYNLSPSTKIRCTSKFPYVDWAYDGCQVFVTH